MEISSILTADILDIIFEGRNKEYGAYELRRSYRKRLLLSLSVMLLFTSLLFAGFALANKTGKLDDNAPLVVRDLELEKVEPEKPIETPPPPKQIEPPPQQQQMKKFTTIALVNDDVKPDEKPPTMDDLADTKIGNINQNGLKDDGIVAPPANDAGKGVVDAPKKDEEDYERTFNKVEIESMYPGGLAAWSRYLHRNLRYPQEAQDNQVSGTVVVQFIVDKEGNVSEVEAVSGPEELRAEAIRVIRKSGKWTAAIQNGRQVKSYKKQPVSFRFEEE